MEHVTITDVDEPTEQSAVGGMLVTLILSGKRATSRSPEAECDTDPLVNRQVYVPEIQQKERMFTNKKQQHEGCSDRKDRTAQRNLLHSGMNV